MKAFGNSTEGINCKISLVLMLILFSGILLISRLNVIKPNPDDVARQQANGQAHLVSSLNISEYLRH